MGFNTTVMILNDQLGSIERDPFFGKKVADAIRSIWCEKGEPADFDGGQVIETHHADGLAAVVVGGNTGRVLGHAGGYGAIRFEGDDLFNILSVLAEQHGYVLKRTKGHEWTLDVLYDGEWKPYATKPSADACKAVARAVYEHHLNDSDLAFRLYDPLGRLYAVSADNKSWRMKWKPGNMRTREQMAERTAEPVSAAAPGA